MHFLLNQEMMREIIMDHFQNPRNKREIDNPDYQEAYMDTTSCIDKIYVQAKIENNVFVDVCWHGTGCAISTASTSIMTELLKGKTVEEARYIITNFKKMMRGEDYDEDCLDEALVFMNTNRQPSRIKCATISFRGIQRILGDNEDD